MGLSEAAVPSIQSGTEQRIGLFGGAFDPPHHAHVALARAAVGQFALDCLHIVPTGYAWHKARTLSAPEHRLAMARLAFTIDTLEALQKEHPQARLYLFMGDDQFAAFQQWHRWQDILDLAIICIAGRAHSTRAGGQFDAYPGFASRFSVLELPLLPVSATQIRQLIASRAASADDLARLVSEPVARYISLHRLYGAR